MTALLRLDDSVKSAPSGPAPTHPSAFQATDSARTAAARAISPVQAVLIGSFSVALWNFGDIARLPVQLNAPGVRGTHYLLDLGHVLAVTLPILAVVAIWTRFGPRKRIWSAVAMAVAVSALSPVVLSGDLEGALERLLPNIQNEWLLPAVCIAVGQSLSGAFLLGRLCVHRRVRWVAVGLGMLLLVLHDFLLKTGYPGFHVLLSASAATLIATSLIHARSTGLGRAARLLRAARLVRLRKGTDPSSAVRAGDFQPNNRMRRWLQPVMRPASIVWTLAAGFSAWSVIQQPSSGLQVELLKRDTTLLFPWLRDLYPPLQIGQVAIPSELRHWFESRVKRPDLSPRSAGFLPERPIVMMITIDALRADVLDPKYRHVAPNLHEIRANSVYFTQARSPGTDTRFSMAALFTGRHYSMLEWSSPKSRRRRLTLERDMLPRFPELLRKAGVQTVKAVSVTMLQEDQGIARGFDEEITLTHAPHYRSDSGEIAEKTIERLRKQGSGPLFYYTHLMDPHASYETYGKEAKSQFDAYLMEVSVADEELGRMRRAVGELGLAHRTIWMISADHGEGFGEHRIYTHGAALYDVLVHVPMMVQIPGVAPRTAKEFVSLMDFAPTVLDIFGVPTPGLWTAESLIPFLAGGRGDPTRVLLMERRSHKAMLFPDGLKVMKRGNAHELYDVIRDPEENDNLWEQMGEESARRLALLQAYVQTHARQDEVKLE